jgi:hypothetical protein
MEATQIVLVCALFALSGIVEAYMDSSKFHPDKSWLGIKYPEQFGPENWRYLYVNGNPKLGRKYWWYEEWFVTFFKSGWHRLKYLRIYLTSCAICVALGLDWWAAWAIIGIAVPQIPFTIFFGNLTDKK